MNIVTCAEKEIETYIKKLIEHTRGLDSRNRVEHLHQIRVNARRLRNALWVYSEIFKKSDIRKWNKSILKLSNLLGDVRDLDVFIAFLEDYRKKVKTIRDRQNTSELIHVLKRKRVKMRPRVLKVAVKFKNKGTYERILKKLAESRKEKNKKKKMNMDKLARQKILERIRNLISYNEVVDKPEEVEELHQMRIAAKHLRYVLEGMKGTYSSDINNFIARVVTFHKQLGDIHDYDVWMGHLSQLLLNKDIAEGERISLTKLNTYCQNLRNRTYKKFQLNWNNAKNDLFFENLGEYVYAYSLLK